MNQREMTKCRERLERFLEDLLKPVGRLERRYWGSVYVRGLLLDGERKSIEPLATRMPEGNVQALQQYVGQSPWEWAPVWERLGKRMTAELEADSAWVLDDTGFPKQGKHSVGVARQYSGTLSQDEQLSSRGEPSPCRRASQCGAELATVLAGKLGEGQSAQRCRGRSRTWRLSDQVGAGLRDDR